MEGLIPMVYRAIKNSRTRRQYKCLSSTELVPLYTMASPVKGLSWVGAERRAAGHRRNKSSGDISSSVDIDYGRGRGSGSVAPAKKQLVRFRSHRWLSCVTGAA